MTQRERILDYIKKHGSITPMDAFNDLGITKLATQVSLMIRNGIDIEKKFEKGTNRFGEPVYFMRYSFPKESNNGGTQDVCKDNH